MLAIAAFCVSVVALLFSGVALAVVFRKEAHSIRLELTPIQHGDVVLGINNDGGIDASVRSVGYFRRTSQITWVTDSVGDYVANRSVKFPFVVKGRSTFETYLNSHAVSPNFHKNGGFCVQLDTGRLYVLTQRVHLRDSIHMHLASWASRLTRGDYALGIKRPRINER